MDFNVDELADKMRRQKNKKIVYDPTECIDYFDRVWCPEDMRFIASQCVGPGEKPKKVIYLKDLNK